MTTFLAERQRLVSELAAAKRRREWVGEEVEKGAISPALAIYAIGARKELDALCDRLTEIYAELRASFTESKECSS